MTPWPVRKIIRTLLRFKSVAAATRQIERESRRTLQILDGLSDEQVARGVTVGVMPGIDEDMRGWSLGQILEHNTIVNRAFLKYVDHLLRGETWESDVDPRRDVMPSEGAGIEQAELFRESVEVYLERVRDVSSVEMAATAVQRHPLFGEFTAKMWHAMFGFHLLLHRRQAEAVAKRLESSGSSN